MMPGPESDQALLTHLLECLERIQDYAGGNKHTFIESRMVQDAVMRNLQTLAESTQRLSGQLKSTEPDIPWDDISGFRNVLTHDYLKLDLELIWQVIENDLKPLADALERMIKLTNQELKS